MELKNSFVLKNVSKKFGENLVLDDVSLEIPKGKVTCILGPSGAGKSTLLKTLNLLENVNQGEIYFEDKIISNEKGVFANPKILRQKIGFVFQSNNLWPNRNILNNLTLGLRVVKKIDKTTSNKKSLKLLEEFGLSKYAKKYPKELSGGEIQRVSICRSLVMDPEVLLLDEITSSLDIELIDSVLKSLMQLRDTGITLVIVTHHIEFAKRIADKIIFIDNGKVVEQGDKRILENPKSLRLEKFIKSVKSIK